MPENTKLWMFDLARFDDKDEKADDTTETDQDEGTDEGTDAAGDQSNSGESDDDASEDTSDGDEEAASKKDDDADALGDKGKQALVRMKAERDAAKKEARQIRRDLAAQRKKVEEFEGRDKTALEKATARAEALEKRVAAATARAVRSEVKAIATEEFADSSDAAAFLGDLTKYADDDGDIDVDQITADIEDLLERKPHLRKRKADADNDGAREESKAKPKPKPKPDRSQGSRGGDVKTDYRKADPDDVEAELSAAGFRSRTRRR